MFFPRKLNFAWLNALPRLRRVAQSSQVKKKFPGKINDEICSGILFPQSSQVNKKVSWKN